MENHAFLVVDDLAQHGIRPNDIAHRLVRDYHLLRHVKVLLDEELGFRLNSSVVRVGGHHPDDEAVHGLHPVQTVSVDRILLGRVKLGKDSLVN